MAQLLENRTELLNYYRDMLLIRRFEEKASEMYTKGYISGFSHLYIGQEAVAVGVMSALTDKDYVITAYREHGQALARGSDPKKVMAELFGRKTGVCSGRGGSMHLFDMPLRFMGGYAIVGGHLPLAVGLGLSIQFQEEDWVVACLFGDGAVNQGAFHESLNLAVLWNVPVVFICEDNQYGMGTAVPRAMAYPDIAEHACAYGFSGHAVDGMDVLAMRHGMKEAVHHVRAGHGPYLLHAKTYRFKGHSMADPKKYRSPQEVEIWEERDPIETFPKKLIRENLAEQADIERIGEQVEQTVEEAAGYATDSPEPPLEALMEKIYVRPVGGRKKYHG